MGLCFMAKGTFGEILKRERELREVTLNEVTVATRIPPRFLEAFEREDWETLPGGIFNRGFVRAIARYLGLDEENLLSEYDLAYGETRSAAVPADDPIPSPPKWIMVAGAVAILLLCMGAISGSVYGWHRYAARRAAKRAANEQTVAVGPVTASPAVAGAASPTPQAPPVTRPATTTTADGATAAPQRLDLAVSTSGATRVRVVADGRVVLDSRLPAGETRRLFARTQFVVSAADPDAVLLELNGQAIPSLNSAVPSGTIVLGQKDLRQAPSGNAQR
jgi:cytoskeleton protein RodZ